MFAKILSSVYAVQPGSVWTLKALGRSPEVALPTLASHFLQVAAASCVESHAFSKAERI